MDMKEQKSYLYTRNAERLQIPYKDYAALIEKAREAEQIKRLAVQVRSDLERVLSRKGGAAPSSAPAPAEPAATVSGRTSGEKVRAPERPAAMEPETADLPSAAVRDTVRELPPIKNEIAEHFNRMDESGRLFNIFKQYYTCLNEMCGGTIRVTMKDGFCSLWNYDEWEEFAFVDIFEGQLRVAIDPRYTDALKSQKLCEVPRLLTSRRNVICVLVEDLNNTVLEVLARAFTQVGVQVG